MKTSLLALGACLVTLHLATAVETGYVAHEWGTFTSVQGADGVQMEWNPLRISELPKFVYDRNRRPGRPAVAELLAAKTALVCSQRMETPVIYFYSAELCTVDVAVKFPSGTITEWYPRDTLAEKSAKSSALRWANVEIVPRKSPAGERLASKLPVEKSGSHYYAARETESDFVRVPGGTDIIERVPVVRERETEKFLFYRGVGNFTAPLNVTIPQADAAGLRLQNNGTEDLRDLFITNVRPTTVNGAPSATISFLHLDKLGAGDTQSATLNIAEPAENQREALTAQLRAALERAGLFPAEAAAMVQTWSDSWLSEPGVRVLYVLPRPWTDSILPLTLEPKPRETVRVMVGRAEVIMPPVERALAAEIERFRSPDDAVRAAAVGNVRALGLGRFLEAALRRFATQHPNDREMSTAGWTLLQEASAPPAPLVSSTR